MGLSAPVVLIPHGTPSHAVPSDISLGAGDGLELSPIHSRGRHPPV